MLKKTQDALNQQRRDSNHFQSWYIFLQSAPQDMQHINVFFFFFIYTNLYSKVFHLKSEAVWS